MKFFIDKKSINESIKEQEIDDKNDHIAEVNKQNELSVDIKNLVKEVRNLTKEISNSSK